MRQSAMAAGFAPVAVASSEVAKVEAKRTPVTSADGMAPAVTVEIEAGGITVRVLRGADSAVLAAIVRALKATS